MIPDNKTFPIIVVHTGAGYEQIITDTSEKEYKQGILEALKAGYNILKNKGYALDAAELACSVLENNPLFNAGVGSVLNTEGIVEMDASLMDGKSQRVGCIANTTKIKNPIHCARKLLEEDRYIFLCGAGAELYALNNNIELTNNSYFITEHRIQQLEEVKFKKRIDPFFFDNQLNEADIIKNYGTVGVVCLDIYGKIASATSTGGTNNKPVGRIGDSAMIGCGTYANNETCGVSCTGKGEPIIKSCNAFNIHAMMKYADMDLKSACNAALNDLKNLGAHAGFIALDKNGNIVTIYNTAMMGRGYIKDDKCEIYVYEKDKDLTPSEFEI